MASYAILTHGDRGEGTASGTFVIPPNVTVYFFQPDTQLLNSAGGEIIEDNLLTAHPNEAGVRAIAHETKTAWETIPNYTATGDADGVFRYPTGVYRVGQDPAGGPVIAIPAGTSRRLSDIIGGQSGGVLGLHIYWLACRAAPLSFSHLSHTRKTETRLNGAPLGRSQNAAPLAPSMVVNSGGRWL
ncbi:hypothetical protein J4558_20940 [Leptolyngbya sp. 15MV]|nr:hypothetical protein J4558_20940 [Leptolyngbya sp. 15MV]